jgi:regulator of RNase E activity RraB
MDLNRINRIKADEETYKALLSRGANPDKEHVIDFFFVGDAEQLGKVETELIKQGYSRAESNEANTLLVKAQFKLSVMESHLITESLENLADEFRVKFDGWGTVVQK